MIGLLVFTFFFATNILAYFLYVSDKHRAYFQKTRVPEAVLLFISFVGGCYGAGMAMWLFRHKTLHTSFLFAVPLSIVIWTFIYAILVISYLKPIIII